MRTFAALASSAVPFTSPMAAFSCKHGQEGLNQVHIGYATKIIFNAASFFFENGTPDGGLEPSTT
jgi:hypothetical protein